MTQRKTQPGMFITLEGVEGSGKSTAINFLKEELLQRHISFITTREPGGTGIAEDIRQILLHHETEVICPETELLLLFAARAQHITHVIQPALQQKQWVLCDRFIDATYAYQGGGRGIDTAIIKQLESLIVKDIWPKFTILLDVPEEIGMRRVKQRHLHCDRFEREELEFFRRVRKTYLDRAKDDPERFLVINAACTLEETQHQLKIAIDTIHKSIKNGNIAPSVIN